MWRWITNYVVEITNNVTKRGVVRWCCFLKYPGKSDNRQQHLANIAFNVDGSTLWGCAIYVARLHYQRSNVALSTLNARTAGFIGKCNRSIGDVYPTQIEKRTCFFHRPLPKKEKIGAWHLSHPSHCVG